jgi:hypothetical protein
VRSHYATRLLKQLRGGLSRIGAYSWGQTRGFGPKLGPILDPLDAAPDPQKSSCPFYCLFSVPVANTHELFSRQLEVTKSV